MYFVLVTLFLANYASCLFDPYIVGGNHSKIKKMPHVGFLFMSCDSDFFCGSSIVNAKVLITAAHCLLDCHMLNPDHLITVSVGAATLGQGRRHFVNKYIVHPKYKAEDISNDIGIVTVKGLIEFSKNTKRIAIMRDPPYGEVGRVAGWGVIDEKTHMTSNYLKEVPQRIWKRSACLKHITSLPKGVVCAGELRAKDYVSSGDSGSGLIVKKYILIGLVSYKMPYKSASLAMYSDVGYYYKWIVKATHQIVTEC